MKDTTMGKFLIVQPNLGLHLLPTHVGFSTKTKKKYIGYDFFPSLLRLYSHTLVFPHLYKLYLNLVFLPQKVINQYSHFYRLCSNILNLCKFNLVFFNINRPFTQYFQPLLTLHLSILASTDSTQPKYSFTNLSSLYPTTTLLSTHTTNFVLQNHFRRIIS